MDTRARVRALTLAGAAMRVHAVDRADAAARVRVVNRAGAAARVRVVNRAGAAARLLAATLTACAAVVPHGVAPVLAGAAAAHAQQPPAFEDAFVDIADVDSTIVVEARYYGSNNFLGRPVAGYEAPRCLLTREAAAALAAVQAELRPFGLGLKTWDCYRPQRAVDDFVRWARDTTDTRMKTAFYPAVDKADLFAEGYIAERSGHSRGSTVDLTLIPLPPAPPASLDAPTFLPACTLPVGERAHDDSLDMGTGYDCFDPLSHTENPGVGPVAARNRLLLRAVMEKHGFRNYEREWWHFTLRGEPFPDTFFDVPVR